ncbi:MAG: amidohydrolase [Flammeovirgaceae bacterium]|nr:amidohydrolase [Flammeovirgaceae bacterium]
MIKQINRRQFVSTLGLGAVGWMVLKSCSTSGPDTVLYNANIHTSDPLQPKAQAIALTEGKIVAVGTDDDILHLAGSNTIKIDIGGKTITPGFIDAHSHPASSGRQHLRNVDCDLRSIRSIQDALKSKADKTAPGEWVSGFKYDDTKTAEGRYITRYDLDQVSPEHPILISHRGGHTAYVNSLALQLAKIDKQTPDPAGGMIVRDENGTPTGLLKENAVDLVSQLIPNEFSAADNQAGVKLITQMMAKTGVTSVTDAYGDPTLLTSYRDAQQANELSARIYCMIGYYAIDKMIEQGAKTGDGDEWVRIGGMKLTCDGSISERTARLSQPYIGRPDDFGIIVMDEDELYEYAIKAHKANWQIGIHANGDVGIDKSLNVFERIQTEHLREDPRFRLEHCTVINDHLVQRIKSLNAIPNPFSTYVYFHGEKMTAYGKERLENMFAVRSFLDAGINVTQTSDYPPGPFEPMMAIQSSVTRTDMSGNVWGPSQKITVEEALKVGTINGAYASYEEKVKGSLEAGKLADLVVLEKDPTQTDPSAIIDIKIERTMVGGKWVYES